MLNFKMLINLFQKTIIHGGVKNNCKVKVNWIHSEDINETNVEEKLSRLSGVLVAPGFGDRGMEGKISNKICKKK